MPTDSPAPAEPKDAPTDGAADQPPAKKRRSRRRRIFLAVMLVFYIVVLVEIASRTYWVIKDDVPFYGGRRDFYGAFYEELNESGVWEADLGPDDGHFDILLLGGSALDRVHGALAVKSQAIKETFQEIVGQPVRTFNLADPAMTTLDSLKKYRLLGEYDRHFDLVVVYHGINDMRMNNVSAEMFRDDYTHMGFYHQLKRMESQIGLLPFFRTPYMIEYTVIHTLDSKTLGLGIYAPRHRLGPEWRQYGGEIKTAGPFRKNLTGLLDLAAQRGEPVLLATFAWYIPDDYSEEACDAGTADYSGEVPADPVEKWGTVETVPKGMGVHNGILRELAAERAEAGNVLLLDFAPMIAPAGENFDDVCHLSLQGKRQFLAAMADRVRLFLESADPQPQP